MTLTSDSPHSVEVDNVAESVEGIEAEVCRRLEGIHNNLKNPKCDQARILECYTAIAYAREGITSLRLKGFRARKLKRLERRCTETFSLIKLKERELTRGGSSARQGVDKHKQNRKKRGEQDQERARQLQQASLRRQLLGVRK